MREQLNSQFRNLRLVDMENRISDNRRRIVRLITDNVLKLRFN